MKVETTDDSIVIRVELPATAGTVWQVLVDPSHISSWWGAYVSFEARPGGQLIERWSDGSREVTTSGRVFHVEPPQSLELTWANDDWPAETRVSFNLSEHARRTELVVIHSGWDLLPAPERATLMRHHAAGWTHNLKNLSDYIRELITGSGSPHNLSPA